MARLFDRISTAGVLKTVVARYQGKVSRIYFRADARFANPEVYEFLEAEAIAAVMPLFRRQRCACSAACSRLSSRQLPADPGDAGADLY